MKRWKLCLALVLTLVVLFSLALSAHAEGELTFTDVGKLKNKMPATILHGLGVINGYPNNTFRPGSAITRAEFCKMLATLDNAGEEPKADYSAAANFTDTKDHALRGSIGYCVAMGYAAGKNAATFDPEGKVTQLEAAKMLLVMLGHDPVAEGFVGANWKERVRIEAYVEHSTAVNMTDEFGNAILDGNDRPVTEIYKTQSGLFKDFDDKALKNLDGNLTRDNACLMFYNALIADCVKVSTSKISLSSSDDTQFTITENLAQPVEPVENLEFDYLNRLDIYGKSTDKKLQLVERIFPKLRVKQDASDEFGRPCGYWINGTKEIGPFVYLDPLFDGEGPITGKSVRAKIGGDPESLAYYLNGKYVNAADIVTAAELLGNRDYDAPNFLREHDKSFCGRLSSNTAASMLGIIWRNSTYQLGKYSTDGTVSGAANRVCYYGTHNEVYYDAAAKRVTVSSEGIFPARVNRVIPAQVDADGTEIAPAYVSATVLRGLSYVKPLGDLELSETLTAKPANDSNALFLASADNAGSGEFTPGEIVLLTFGYKGFDTADGGTTYKYVVRTAYRTTAIPGKISGPVTYSSAKATTVNHFRMNGNSRPNYLPIRKNDIFNVKKFSVGDSYTIYTGVLSNYSGSDITSWVFYAESTVLEQSDRVVYVIKAGTETDMFGEKTYRAKLVNSAGEIIDVVTDQNYTALTDCLASYSIDINDKYTLLKVGNSGLGSFSVKQGNAMMTLTPAKSTAISIRGDQDLDFSNERSIVADDSTLFILGSRPNEDEDMVYTTYKGIKNVPDADSTPYYNFAEKDGVATVVFIYENKAEISASSYGMLFKTDKDVFKTYTLGSTGYYEMEAVINDEPKTVQVTPKLYASLKYGINLFSGLSTNTEGWISSVTLLNSKYVYPITAIEPTEKGVLHMNFDENGNGGVRYITHGDLHIYTYSLRSRKASVISEDQLSELGETETATELFGANAASIKKGFYTLHETYEGKPLAGVFIIVD